MSHSKARKIGLAFAVALASLFFMMLSGCPHPVPPPVPGPTPPSADAAVADAAPSDTPVTSDPFKGKDFDCHLPVVAAQYGAALTKVAACLGSPPLACLAGLLPTYDIDTVACLVRDLGFAANNAMLAAGLEADATVASTVRTFINSEDLGFR